VLVPLFMCLVVTRFCRTCDFARYIGFIALHLSDYLSNVLTIFIFWRTAHDKYLLLLVPAHLIVGFFCVYTALNYLSFGSLHPLLKYLLVFLPLGLMQLIQVKLAHDDYTSQRRQRQQEGEAQVDPDETPMTPARFHCKALDGILEGTMFSFVCSYALLKVGWVQSTGVPLSGNFQAVLYVSACLSFLTIGLALLELDFRTSDSVQRILNMSLYARLKHYLFRVSEVMLRLLTVLVFVIFMRPSKAAWWIAFVIVAADYLLGVALLCRRSGRGGGCAQSTIGAILLGVPFFLANVMQFVDAPGMSGQARRISRIILPIRFLELLGVTCFCVRFGTEIKVPLYEPNQHKELDMLSFIFQWHPVWALCWVSSGIVYYILLVCYACRHSPEADVHAAVAYGDLDGLRAMVARDQSVDVNRYSPDGLTPLHLAVMKGNVLCVRELLAHGASIRAFTRDHRRQTAIQLAVLHNPTTQVLKLLCEAPGAATMLNVKNYKGDTALHLAAKMRNVAAVRVLLSQGSIDVSIKNESDKTARDYVTSENFEYDKSREGDMLALFRQHFNQERIFTPSNTSMTPVTGRTIASSSSSSVGAGSPQGVDNAAVAATTDAPTPTAEHGDGAAVESRTEPHMVPLATMSRDAEARIRSRAGSRRNSSDSLSPSGSRVALPTFMLTAGHGAVSRALAAIQEATEFLDPSEDLEVANVKADDFEVIGHLGDGTFGKVDLVRHRETREQYAMKTMTRENFQAHKASVKMAHTERHFLKTTRHPCIVSLHYAFQGPTFWALVMEFCPNGDLQDHLVRECERQELKYGLEPLSEVARIAGEVLLAIEHLHSMQVIFRDVKLENVLMDEHFHAKVTDFGLAKQLDSTGAAKTRCGSLRYLAPEIWHRRQYTYSVDIYAYGVTLYMLLSGGDASPRGKQRLPPGTSRELQIKLREASEKRVPWLQRDDELQILSLLQQLTNAEKPERRGTASSVKHHAFFTVLLQGSVDSLLERIVAP